MFKFAVQKNSTELLGDLVPLNALSQEALQELSDKVIIEDIPKGEYLFREGDTDMESFYLLSGNIQFLAGSDEVEQIDAGSTTARFPLAHQFPRSFSARAKTRVSIVRIDMETLNEFESRFGKAEVIDSHLGKAIYQVSDIGFEDLSEDWMTRMLQSPLFQKVPATEIQTLLIGLKERDVAEGELVVHHGDPAESFYILKSGRCTVSYASTEKGPSEVVGDLVSGDTFGGESLISGVNYFSLKMKTAGAIYCLAPDDFSRLIRRNVVEQFDYEQACGLIEEDAVWLDIRDANAYHRDHLSDASNWPYIDGRFAGQALPQDVAYIVYSDDVAVCMAAVFRLCLGGYDAVALNVAFSNINKSGSPFSQAEAVSTIATVSATTYNQSKVESVDSPVLKTLLADMETLELERDQAKQMAADAQVDIHNMTLEKEALGTQLDTRIATIQTELDESRTRASGYEAELLDASLAMEARNAELQVQLDELEHSRDDKNDQLEQTEKRLSEQNKALESLRLASESMEADQTRSDDRVCQLEESNAQLTEQVESIVAQRDLIQQALDDVKAEFDQKQNDFEEAAQTQQDNIEELGSHNEDIQQKLNNLRQHSDTTISSLRTSLDGLTGSSSATEKDLADTQTDLQALRQCHTDLESESQTTVAQLREDTERHTEKIQLLQSALESSNNDLEEQRSRAHAHEGELNNKIQQLSGVELSLEDLQLRHDQITAQLEQSSETCSASSDELASQKSQINLLFEQEKEKTETIESLEASLSGVRSENAVLDERSNGLHAELDNVRNTIVDFEQERDNLQKTVFDQEVLLSEKNDVVTRSYAELDEIKSELHIATTALEKLEQDGATRSQSLADRDGRISQLEDQFKTLTEEQSVLEESVQFSRQELEETQLAFVKIENDLNDARADLERERDSFQKTLVDQETLLSEKDDVVTRSYAELDEVKTELHVATTTLAQLEQDGATRSQSLADRDERISQLEDQFKTLTEEQSVLEESAQSVRQELEEAQLAFAGIEKDLDDARVNVGNQEKIAEKDQIRITELESEVKIVTDELGSTRSAHDELEKTQGELRSENADITGSLSESQNHAESLIEELRVFRQENESLLADRERLSVEIEQARALMDDQAVQLQDSLRSVKDTEQGFVDDKIRVEEKLADTVDLLGQAEQKRDELKSEIKRYESELESKDSEWQELAEKLSAAEKFGSLMEKSLAEEKHFTAEMVASFDETQQHHVEANRVAETKRDLLGQTSQEQLDTINRVESELLNLAAEKESLLKKINEMTAASETLSDDRDQLVSDLESKTDELEVLESSLALQAQDAESLQQNLAESRAELSRQVNSSEANLAGHSDLQNKNELLLSVRIELEEQLETSRERIETQSEEIRVATDAVSDMTSQLSGRADRVAELTLKVESLTQTLESTTSGREALSGQLEQTRNELKKTQAELVDAELSMDMPIPSSIIESEELESGALQCENETLKHELTDLRSVMTDYVVQLQADKEQGGSDEVLALKAELKLVRDHSSGELQVLRRELDSMQVKGALAADSEGEPQPSSSKRVIGIVFGLVSVAAMGGLAWWQYGA